MVEHFNEGRGFAGYIRVSSDGMDFERSVAAQKEVIQKFAQEHGSGNIAWYIDKGTGLLSLPFRRSGLMPGLPSPVSTRCWCTVSPV